MIWFNKGITLDNLKAFSSQSMSTHLGMEWLEIGPDFLVMRMPVDDRTRQPYGLLHGGASCALAETVGSVGSQLIIDAGKYVCVGMEINANHIRSARAGYVTAKAVPLHVGKFTHVWDIRIHDDDDKLVCVCRLTVAVLGKMVDLRI